MRKAAGIIDALRSSLDSERGGDMADNLERLYDYMGRELTHANLHDDAAALLSIINVNETLRGAWSAIPEEARRGSHGGLKMGSLRARADRDHDCPRQRNSTRRSVRRRLEQCNYPAQPAGGGGTRRRTRPRSSRQAWRMWPRR